jgi:ATP-dependent DNA helicase HFM1/MER3
MCETELEEKYKSLSQGKSILESCLHLNLAEHLNSEIGLGTITSIDSAKRWLRNSFMFHRIRKNPNHYQVALTGGGKTRSWEERIEEMVTQSVQGLQESELVVIHKQDGKLESTEYGDIMSKVRNLSFSW